MKDLENIELSDEEKEKNRNAFQRIKEKCEDDFEKQITYINAGALGLTFTFIEKIVPFSKAINLWLLIIGWLFLIWTLLVNLGSHYFSKYQIDKTIDDMDNNIPNLHLIINKRNKVIDKINMSTILSLILGIFFIIVFVYTNAINMAKQDKPQQGGKEQLGRTIPKVAPTTSNGGKQSSSTDAKNK